jgi:glycogen operon protein
MMLRLSDGAGHGDVVYIAFNMFWEGLSFLVPSAPAGMKWYVAVQTAKSSPMDASEPGEEWPLADQRFVVLSPRSIVVLVAK